MEKHCYTYKTTIGTATKEATEEVITRGVGGEGQHLSVEQWNEMKPEVTNRVPVDLIVVCPTDSDGLGIGADFVDGSETEINLRPSLDHSDTRQEAEHSCLCKRGEEAESPQVRCDRLRGCITCHPF